MQKTFLFEGDLQAFKDKALQWATSFDVAHCFNSNAYADVYSAFDFMLAVGAREQITVNAGAAFDELERFLAGNEDWVPGYLAYDLKNELEDVKSSNPNYLGFPDMFFFKPCHVLTIKGNEVHLHSGDAQVMEIIERISLNEHSAVKVDYQARFTRDEYIQSVEAIKGHIKRGDIYEMNFCQEFYAEDVTLNPLDLYFRLNRLSPAPFSAFFKNRDHYIISASPERYLSKRGNKLISQPIKGTTARSADPLIDAANARHLRNSEKEQSENVMIVDLVRNDLTRVALQGTVRVEELFGIYSFKHVHQMISTVCCEVADTTSPAEIIKASFPMGSMTGAPKIRAMEIIDRYELNQRSVYSGAIGYFSPEGDFDFNVIIRSLCYNASTGYLSFQTGGAITYACDPEQEYEECMLKGEAIFEALR